ncbi:cadmium-translocating P-type ATPase [Thermoanaerobacterium thermosaccharolyticum DSM 571]|uniref:Cadmium-translocating P-type ATPase n=1 Tax=Thermoanaerobacterium thermosaccharolyticum (strain ATCC 7956 / DSM 571 / NCIMB 9385 / NCA 3814 / NCTC 13789 / WDCM 00135 / 2032) TaxID=580327 RepID=D9TSQ0_THETC|nr:heavy metal translocating P-type ATPase [Thermoanaerobacterium thermosaccharolyticum]ADL69905.1 cadmium-translocating P-type ATPase [Thermoanaerobacterium thermosaccharolyticum DSM 571]
MKGSKQTFLLEGLDCAVCAAKIEDNVKKIDGICNANVDLINTKLTVELKDINKINDINKTIKKVVKDVEPNIHISDSEVKIVKDKDSRFKWKIMQLLSAAALFILPVIFKLPEYAKFSFFFISYIISGGEIIALSIKKILKGQLFDENFLMSISTIGAFAIGKYEEGVSVMLFYQIGTLIEDYAVDNSRKSIKDLMDIRPDYANLKIENNIKKVPPEAVNIGDIILVKPGEKIPLDGKVIDGKSFVDTSSLTGEYLPMEVGIGSNVLSGFINKNGLLTVKVEKNFKESTVSKILDLIENAGNKKAQAENFITKFAKYYTPIVTLSALFIATIPPLLLNENFSNWIYRALVFLVISCPCALVISIPLSFFSGIGAASKSGILIKGSNYLEALNDVKTIVFDKTGTLTEGTFKVTEINAENPLKSDELLKYAAYGEYYSNHPIASSIVNAYGSKIDAGKIKDYVELAGNGIKAIIDDKEILIGNSKLMKSHNIAFKNVRPYSAVHIAVDGKYAGYIVISDTIKKDSKDTVKALKSLGVERLIMLTGDKKEISEYISNELGLDDVYSELLPDEKVNVVDELCSNTDLKGKVAFVGDGINDAPALTRADVGIAMGKIGTDAAIEAADVVLMTDEPYKLVDAIKIAKKTHKIVLENIIFALGVKLSVLTLGALGLATMWEAVFADVGVTVLAVLNSLRILTK